MTAPNRYGFQVRPGMRRGLRSAVPLPTRLVSNEEFPPIPQTPAQRQVEDRILAEAERLAPRLGLSRREFLRKSGGMATSLLAMNAVFGRFFDVSPVEAADPAAFRSGAARRSSSSTCSCTTSAPATTRPTRRRSRKGAVSKQALLGLRRGTRGG